MPWARRCFCVQSFYISLGKTNHPYKRLISNIFVFIRVQCGSGSGFRVARAALFMPGDWSTTGPQELVCHCSMVYVLPKSVFRYKGFLPKILKEIERMIHLNELELVVLAGLFLSVYQTDVDRIGNSLSWVGYRQTWWSQSTMRLLNSDRLRQVMALPGIVMLGMVRCVQWAIFS